MDYTPPSDLRRYLRYYPHPRNHETDLRPSRQHLETRPNVLEVFVVASKQCTRYQGREQEVAVFSHILYTICIRSDLHWQKQTWAESFWIVDIEINAQSPIFINLKINLIFSLYPGKCNSISVDCWFRIQKANQKSRNFEALHTRGLSYPQVTIPWKQGWAPPIAHMGSSGSAGSDLASLSVSSTRVLSSVRFLWFN